MLNIQPVDLRMREALERIWNARSLSDLERLLRGPDHHPLTFSLDLPPQGQLPTLSFRHPLWHPHEGLDLTGHWLNLCRAYLIAANTETHAEWVDLMRDLDSQASRADGWSLAIQTLGLSHRRTHSWALVIREYVQGRRLSRPTIDRYGVLPTIHRR